MSQPYTRILALVPNWIGDVAMCTPALRALRRRFPDAALTAAGCRAACDLLRGLPWFDALVLVPSRPGFGELARLGRRLRPHARDLAVVFPHSFRAALLAWLTGADQRAAYKRGGRSWLLTDPVPPYRENGRIQPIYMGRQYLDLVKSLGCEDDGQGLELRVDPGAVEAVRKSLVGDGPFVGLAPGAAFGPSKLWPAERFARVADLLGQKTGARCVLLTGPGEDVVGDGVVGAAGSPLIRCDDGEPTVEKMKAAISQLDLLICNDSGQRHVAVAFKVPTVCIMGPTSPRYSEGPYERGKVLRLELDCAPCQKPVCPIDHCCMTGISPEWVAETAMEYLIS